MESGDGRSRLTAFYPRRRKGRLDGDKTATKVEGGIDSLRYVSIPACFAGALKVGLNFRNLLHLFHSLPAFVGERIVESPPATSALGRTGVALRHGGW